MLEKEFQLMNGFGTLQGVLVVYHVRAGFLGVRGVGGLGEGPFVGVGVGGSSRWELGVVFDELEGLLVVVGVASASVCLEFQSCVVNWSENCLFGIRQFGQLLAVLDSTEV